VIRAGSLCLCLFVLPAAHADDELVDGLRRWHGWSQVGRRIAELDADWHPRDDWVRQAAILVELGETADGRAAPVLLKGLEAKDPRVVDFALHGLARLSPATLVQGAGAALPAALLDLVSSPRHYHALLSRRLLTALAGEDLGETKRAWKRWLKRAADDLVAEEFEPPFDPEIYADDVIAAAQRELDEALRTQPLRTAVRPRIPDLGSRFLGLRKNGLDLFVCLDQTGSMVGVITEAKARMGDMLAVLELLAENYRMGFLTFDDEVKRVVPLSDDMDLIRRSMPLGVVGGGDLPEGVDKALDAAFARKIGWRRRAVKAVVVIGDAPPHDPDVEGMLERVEQAHRKQGFVVSAVSTGRQVIPEFAQLAEAGGGQSLLLGSAEQLTVELLLLSLGEELRPVTERLVPVALEILAEADAGR